MGFGKTGLAVECDGDLIQHQGGIPVADEMSAIREALGNPTGTKPLRDIVAAGEKVAIVVNDITRLTRTDLFLPPIVETLNQAGIPTKTSSSSSPSASTGPNPMPNASRSSAPNSIIGSATSTTIVATKRI